LGGQTMGSFLQTTDLTATVWKYLETCKAVNVGTCQPYIYIGSTRFSNNLTEFGKIAFTYSYQHLSFGKSE